MSNLRTQLHGKDSLFRGQDVFILSAFRRMVFLLSLNGPERLGCVQRTLSVDKFSIGILIVIDRIVLANYARI